MDPDLHKNLMDLGFIRNLTIDGAVVSFDVHLTTPACPAKDALERESREVVEALEWVEKAVVRMTATTRGLSVGGALPGVANIVAVGAGKGGVGKSTTAVNLAYALAQAGARVGLLDADVYGPSIPQMTGAERPTHELDGKPIPQDVGGVKVLSMGMFVSPEQASVLRGPRVGAVVRQFLTDFAWGELDYLLVDCPPGTGDVLLTLAQAVPLAGAVLVTTPQGVALADARKAADMFEKLEVPVLGVIETMARFICDHCDTPHDIFGSGGGEKLATRLGVPLLTSVPIDPKVVRGGDRAVPAVVGLPGSSASKAYVEAAGALASELAVLASTDQGLATFELVWRS